MLKKRILALLLWSGLLGLLGPTLSFEASAVPATPYPVTYTQSDGTQLTIRIVGDEFYNYTLSEEGYTLVGGADGDFYFAKLSPQGELVPTEVKARPIGRLSGRERLAIAGLRKGLKPARSAEMEQRRAAMQLQGGIHRSADGKLQPPGGITSVNALGKFKALVILVEFADVHFTTANPQSAFYNLLMQDGYSVNGATGSAWNYYNDNSAGQFDLDCTVVGPYRISEDEAHYAGKGGTENPAQMVVEACRKADADVNFADYAEDGVIRDIFIFFAGKGQADGGGNYTIWPHRWDVRGDSRYQSVYLDGVWLKGYACGGELEGRSGNLASIGTFCHEFGHVLGWPDFYDTNGQNTPAMSYYSLMDTGCYNNGGKTPPANTILERWMMGWAEPTEITKPGDYTLDPVWENQGYLITTPTDDDYFLMECRAVEGFVWDQHISCEDIAKYGQVIDDRGMMVYHVDYTPSYRSRWKNNTINTLVNHECMRRVYNAKNQSSYGNGYYYYYDSFYPGVNNVTSLTPESNEIFKAWSGKDPLFCLTDIKLSGTQISFTATPTDLPDLEFEVEPEVTAATIRWKGDLAPKWRLRWRESGASEYLGDKEITTGSHELTGLKHSTEYEVGLTPIGGECVEAEQSFTFTTLLDVGFRAEAGQYEAQLSWNGEAAESWHVRWMAKGSSESLGSMTIRGSYCQIEGLEPGTAYEIGITPSGEGVQEIEQLFEIATPQRNAANKVHIQLPSGGFKSNTATMLHLVDGDKNVRSAQWFLNGEQIPAQHLFPAGTHTLTASFTLEDGSKCYLMKYITVK